eukprot:4009546-Heterocapsa_arctica.AAC.1
MAPAPASEAVAFKSRCSRSTRSLAFALALALAFPRWHCLRWHRLLRRARRVKLSTTTPLAHSDHHPATGYPH